MFIGRLLRYEGLLYKGKVNPIKLARCGFHYSKSGKLYYIHDYYSKSRYPEKHKTDIDTRKVLRLKSKDPDAIEEYSCKIATFISNAVPEGRDYTVIAVPSSDKDNKSCMEYCIETIRDNPEMITNKSIHLLDYNYSLTRTDTINKSHKSITLNRPSAYDHIRTIRYRNKPTDPICNAIVILIDDIATTGTTINACKRRLMCSKIKNRNIVKLVMARTVYDKEGKKK